MNKKRIVLLSTVLVLVLAFSSVGVMADFETRRVWGFLDGGMQLDVYAPYQGYAGSNITIRVRVEAKEDLRNIYIKVSLYGSNSNGYAVWSTVFYALYDVALSTGVIRDVNVNITVPSDVDSGLIYGYAECNWEEYIFIIWIAHSRDGPFNVVYLRNLLDERDDWMEQASYWENQYNTMESERDSWKSKYEEKLNEFNELNSTYNEYEQTHSHTDTEYDELESKYDASTGDLGTARSLSYVFVIFTIIFVATTVYLAIRKPKVKPLKE